MYVRRALLVALIINQDLVSLSSVVVLRVSLLIIIIMSQIIVFITSFLGLALSLSFLSTDMATFQNTTMLKLKLYLERIFFFEEK